MYLLLKLSCNPSNVSYLDPQRVKTQRTYDSSVEYRKLSRITLVLLFSDGMAYIQKDKSIHNVCTMYDLSSLSQNVSFIVPLIYVRNNYGDHHDASYNENNPNGASCGILKTDSIFIVIIVKQTTFDSTYILHIPETTALSCIKTREQYISSPVSPCRSPVLARCSPVCPGCSPASPWSPMSTFSYILYINYSLPTRSPLPSPSFPPCDNYPS